MEQNKDCGCHDHECHCHDEEQKYSDVAMKNMNDGMQNQMAGKFEEAIKNYEATIKELAKTQGEDGPDIGYCKHYIASCLSSLGKADEAKKMYDEALKLHTKNFGEKSSNVGRVYSELGLVNYHQNKFQNTLDLEDKALFIFNNDVEAQPFERALNSVICNDIKGACYRTVGLLGDAVQSYNEAIKALKDAMYNSEDAFANYYVSIGQCELDLEHYKVAQENFQKAVDIYKKNEKDYATALVNSEVFLAASYLHQENAEKMIETYDDAFKVCEKNMEKDCTLFKELAVTAGDMCAYALKADKAYEYYKLAVRSDIKKDDDQQKAIYQYAYHSLAEIAAHLGKMGEAMEYQEKAKME